MYNRFKELGVPAVITRSDDRTLTREERLNTMTKSFGNDSKVIVLSNHINAGGGEGAEVVYPLRTSSILPNAILNEIGSKGQIKRKIYQRVLPENPSKDYYYIMRETPNTTSLLIEYGFIDNSKDRKKLKDNILDYAEGVVKAVSEYIGINYSSPKKEVAPGPKPIDENGKPLLKDEYTVEKGDNLYSIALKNNVTVDEIKRLNKLTNNNLEIGQILKIPPKKIEEEYDIYIVEKGDTLYSISKKYNLTVNDLITYNRLQNTVLEVNQELKIPRKKETITPPKIDDKEENIEEEIILDNNSELYIVQNGDTLYGISRKYSISVDELKLLNNLNSNILTIGQKLIVPKKVIEEKDYIVYEVVPGDTLYSIAKKYNTKVDTIKAYNNLENNLLKIGQVLQIPNEEIDVSYQIYQIKNGDTLYSIARKYGKSVQELQNINNVDIYLLQIGDTIKIPL